MASILKQAKRGLRKRSEAVVGAMAKSDAPWLRRAAGPMLCYLDMLVVDYGVVRLFFNNRHRVGQDAWRSAQPAPYHIAMMARRGIKTIINLRGDQSAGTKWLEEQACARHGVNLINLKLRSRAPPTRQELWAVREVLQRADYPILVHCKSGADRAGLMSVMIRHVRDGEPIADAINQLSLRFGHIRQADTGVLDEVFQRYLEDAAKAPIEFWHWVDTVYDPSDIQRAFKSNKWASRLVDRVLRRE